MRQPRALLVPFLFCFGLCLLAFSQQSSSDGRKLVKKTNPVYPAIARKMNLGGTVKVVAVVSPDGSVKKVEPVGGSPVLIQAAEDAVAKWKFSPSESESREVVELHFNP